MSTAKPGKPIGGWLNRIEKGTADLYLDTEPAPAAPHLDLKITPRTEEVLKVMLHLGGWWRPIDAAEATDVPAGTVSPILARLESHGWARSERVGDTAVRRYALTTTGVECARAILDEPQPEPGPPGFAGTAATGRGDLAERANDIARDRDDVAARRPAGEDRVWTMAELAAADPALAAAVRRRLTGR